MTWVIITYVKKKEQWFCLGLPPIFKHVATFNLPEDAFEVLKEVPKLVKEYLAEPKQTKIVAIKYIRKAHIRSQDILEEFNNLNLNKLLETKEEKKNG